DTSAVTILSKVTIKSLKNKAKITYQLVSESEADLSKKKISVSSPMGKGLLGKAVGEVATVKTPNGEMQFEVVDISL
ncbi:MAG: GreA/GreB family elongation factor, partial [Bacteroidota bacterium]